MNSPFIDQISDCKKTMRKLRKKIYKHTINQSDKKTANKSHDLSSILINIFQKRNLPPTIVASLKNKRNIDIFSLKSLVIGNQSSLKLDLTTLRSKTSSQQKQVQQMYKEHCQRMQELKKLATPRFNRKLFNSNYISSTQNEFSSQSQSNEQNSDENEYSQYQENQSQEINHNSFEHSIVDDIFSEVLQDIKNNSRKVQVHAFSCFEMGESSLLQGQNIFNF